jgi:CBS domain-containing protein
MRIDVVAVASGTPIEVVRDLLLERGISGAPVLNEGRRPIGIVSKTDLLRYRGPRGAIVDDVMTPLAVSLGPEASVAKAAALMVSEGIHRILVVSEDGELLGIVTPLDILRMLAATGGY